MENLYNEAYSLLPIEEKKEILENLAKKYNMELLRKVSLFLFLEIL